MIDDIETEKHDPDDCGSFAMRLFHARGAHPPTGLTQAQLAERAGLQQSAIAHYEAGRREPSLANLRRLVWATGAGADYLLATRPDADDFYRESGVVAERPPERRFTVKVVAPQEAPEAVRASAGDVEIVGNLYVLHAPEHSSAFERETAAALLERTLKEAHGDGSPFSFVVLPHGWSLDLHEVEPV